MPFAYLTMPEITPWRLTPGDYTPNCNPPERNLPERNPTRCACPGDNPLSSTTIAPTGIGVDHAITYILLLLHTSKSLPLIQRPTALLHAPN